MSTVGRSGDAGVRQSEREGDRRVICGAIGQTDDGLVVFCELEHRHGGDWHDVLLVAGDPDDPDAADIDRYGEHFAWPNTEPDPPPTRPHFVHNCIAHPLLVLWPRLGRWLHDKTEP